MDFDILKNKWQKAASSMRVKDSGQWLDSRKATSLDRLAARYRRFATLSFVVMVATAFNLIPMREVFPTWIILCLIGYFGIASVMDYWLWKGIEGIDCTTMTVEDVLRRCLFYRKRHLQFIVVLLPMALGVLTAMFIQWKADIYMIGGMAAGFVVGAAIGVRKLIDFLNDYRNILSGE